MKTIPYFERNIKRHDVTKNEVQAAYDSGGQLAEIEVSHASKHVDLDEVRRKQSFKEVHSEKAAPQS